ncbi:MAG TPA: VTT domain-containing protein [Nitrospirota bacterium]|nr:VTT domain-containing protein [Nitrospirota bacterium]
MHSIDFFISFAEAHRYWGYGLIFFAMIFEGELFLVVTGMLARIQAFDFFDALFFTFSGVLSGDMLWYWTGRLLQSRYPTHRITAFVVHRVKKYLPTIDKNPFHVIFLSKFIYGLNHSTIVMLGLLKTPFGHFLRIQAVASCIWTLLFLTVGYIFGSVAITYTKRLQHFLLITLLSLVLVAISAHVIGYFIKKREQKHT